MYNGAVHANVAQLVEHVIRNDKVASSILAIGSFTNNINHKKEGAVRHPLSDQIEANRSLLRYIQRSSWMPRKEIAANGPEIHRTISRPTPGGTKKATRSTATAATPKKIDAATKT